MDKSKGCRSRHVRDRQTPLSLQKFYYVCTPDRGVTSSKKSCLQSHLAVGDFGTRPSLMSDSETWRFAGSGLWYLQPAACIRVFLGV